ncbi:hypothetical protein [Sphingopyxis macrogoltabida]|nr:hypothetical protein [Sphingopyxis macrogoltabida]
MKRIGHERTAAGASLAALALVLAGAGVVPVSAQQTETPTPAPSSGRSIDFRLPPADEGRTPGVQGPSDNGLPPVAPGERRGAPTPTPAPQPAPPRVTPTQPSTPARPAAGTAAPAPTPSRRDTPAASTSRSAANDQPAAAVEPPASDNAAPSLPPVTSGPTDSAASVAPPPADDGASVAVPKREGSGTPLWAWLLAGLAALGAGIWYWRRRPLPAGAAPAEYVPPVEPAAPRPTPRAAAPARAPTPPAPAARPSAPAGRTAAPLVTRPADEQRAMVAMALEIRDIRMTADQVVVSLALNLANQGPVAATGLMVRIALGQGSAMPEAVLARFFDGAGGSVLRDDIAIEPGAGEQISTEVMLPRAAIEPLMIAGRPMLIPVAAFDVTYHWDGPGEAFGQNAGSFVLGREQGGASSEKLAPLPLDRAQHRVDRPGARATAMRRAQ